MVADSLTLRLWTTSAAVVTLIGFKQFVDHCLNLIPGLFIDAIANGRTVNISLDEPRILQFLQMLRNR
jgi:hypothetical protein